MDTKEQKDFNTYPKYAWFSQKAKIYNSMAKKYPLNKTPYISHIYLDTNGNEVEVTVVGDQKDFKYIWDDKVYKGKVVKWLRNVS